MNNKKQSIVKALYRRLIPKSVRSVIFPLLHPFSALKKPIRRIKRWTGWRALYLFVPAHQKKVVLSSFIGGGFGSNPKYIALEFLRRGGYDLVWLVDTHRNIDFSAFPDGIRTVEYDSRKARWEMATAKYWIGDEVCTVPIPKKKSQIYIMASHGSFAIKKCWFDANIVPDGWAEVINKYANVPTYYVIGYKEDEIVYRSAVSYKGDFLKIGFPRYDILYDAAARVNFRKKLGFTPNSKVVLYAPTFRMYSGTEVYNLDYAQVRAAFSKLYKTKEIEFLIRLHPSFENKFGSLALPSFMRDFSKYPDIQELLCAADVLITDYSSSPFDFIVTRRPVFLYANDWEDYNAHEFGLKNMPEQLPFEYGYTNEELCRKIKEFDNDAYTRRIEQFLLDNEFYGDGHSSKTLVDIMEKKIPPR